MVRELVLPEVLPEATRCAPEVRLARAVYRELFGHSWSEPNPDQNAQKRRKLAPFYSVLEAARAEVVADILLQEPKTVSAGLLPDASCLHVAPHLVAMDLLASLRFTVEGEVPQDDQARANALVQSWQIERGALELVARGGRHHARVVDARRWQQGLIDLLTLLFEIERNGDRGTIEKLVEHHAMRIDPRLRDEVLARLERVGVPWRIAILPPTLEPVRDATGAMVDAKARPARNVDDLIGAYRHR